MDRLISLAIILLMLMAGCNTTNHQNSTVKETAINISYVDQQGNDLLKPDHPNAITEQNTDLYYLVDGKKEKYFEDNLDSPKGFFISDEKLSDRYTMLISPNIDRDQRSATTYIQFKDATMDTIKVAYEIESNSTVVTKVWYNGEVRWDVDGDNNNEENIEYTSRYFVVTRE